jgi:glycosyltransferase involved in cell wall biosynthesis
VSQRFDKVIDDTQQKVVTLPKSRLMDNILIIVYNHPEGFPPTLNAVDELSKIASTLVMVGRNTGLETWTYPSNCKVYYSGDYIEIRKSEQQSIFKKIRFFLDFLFLTISKGRTRKWDLVIAYDPMGLLACRLALPFLKGKPLLWYHNHDVFEEATVRKYSVQWWAGVTERSFFKKLDIFSLPADERKKHFPLEEFKGKYFLLPNYPSIKFFGSFYKPKKLGSEIRLIFQGSIAEGHGLEELVQLLDQKVEGRSLRLVIKGWIRDGSFRQKLENMANGLNAGSHLEFVGFGPYNELPGITASCDIGIGIHALNTDLHVSLGKASNKLYEYASVGLPIIVFDNPHYRGHFETKGWVFFTDLSRNSLLECITQIARNYDNLSRQARHDFESELNYASNFKPVVKFLSDTVARAE